MNLAKLFMQVFTGPNNETIAWGRVLGAVVFVLFVVLLPYILLVLVTLNKLEIAEARGMFDSLAFYLPTAALASWSFVTGTGMFEPKKRDEPQG